MRMIVYVDGHTFTSVEDKKTSVKDAVDLVYKGINDLDKMEITCDTGAVVILCEEMLKKAIIVISDE